MAYVSLQDVKKTYGVGEATIHAADGVSFEIEKGEFAVIVGPRGAGSTSSAAWIAPAADTFGWTAGMWRSSPRAS